ncbi:Oxoglutarate iron-dependent oxygenase [Colletotrichum asianum]
MRLLAALGLLGGVAVAAEGCHGDNLLRGLERHGAEEYCSAVLGVAEATGTVSIPEGVPTGYEEAKVSSACWCLLGTSSATAAPPCHSKSAEGPMYSTADGDMSATATETSTEASGVVGRPAPTDTDIPGGYSFSAPGDGLTATTAWTCGLAEATTTVQVTETSVETVYVTALSSEGNAGRPPPPSASSGVSSTSGGEFTVITLSGEPSGTSSGWLSTITVPVSEIVGVPVVTTIVSDGSEIVSTLTRTPLKSPQGRIGTTITMVINGTVTTITGEVHDVPPPTQTETSASSSSSGASQWTLPWISESTQSSPTMTPTARISTITSNVGGGVVSTWVVTLPTGIPFPNTTSTSPASTTLSGQVSTVTSIISGEMTIITIGGPSLTTSWNGTAATTTSTPSETRSGDISVVTSVIGGEATTITLIGGSTIRPANGTSIASSIPSETTSAGISVITSFIDGEATTITPVGGSTLSGSPNATASTTPTPSESSSAEVSIITSVIGGEITTITVVGGSTLIPANATSSFTASDTQPGSFSVVTTVIGGSATTLTLSGGSTLAPSSALTTATATSSPSQTLSAGVSVTTSFIDGVATTITVSDGSTLTTSLASDISPSPTATGGIIVITSIIDGSATTVTISDGSTIVSPTTTSSAPASSPTGEVIVVTSTINGKPNTFTMSEGLTLVTLMSSSAATAMPSPTGGVIVITSIIEGQPTTFTVSDGTTLGTEPSSAPVSPTTTANGGVIVITSTINGAVSTITVSNGSTVETPASSTATPRPTPSIGVIVVTTLINGEATTITVSDGVTLGEPSPTISSTPALTGEVIVITTTINGEPTTVTVSDGSTLSTPTSATTSQSQSPTPTVGVIVITTIISGAATTLTVSDGSTLTRPLNTTSPLTQTPIPTGEFITITSTINGEPITLTISDGSTLFPTPSPTNGPDVITVISSVIGGGASTWIISDGVTLPLPSNTTSPTSTPTGQIIVLTSIINGAASTWTVSDGSTLSPSATTTTASTPTGDAVTLTSTLPDGRVSIWTLIGTATITGSQNATATSSSSSSSATASSTSSAFDSAFTGISIVASQNASTCYTLPSPIESLHESKLDTQGKTAPYIDAFYLDNTTNSVKYIRLMNESTSDPILIDVSDPAKLAIIDKDGDTLSVDSQGLHFASAGCSPKIDVFISGFFNQINSLTNSTCTSAAALFNTPSGRPLQKRQTSAFDVLLRLKDQCGNAARDELPVAVSLGDNPCAVVPKEGDFVATCSWPGGSGPAGDCETSVEQTLDHLTKGSLDGTCPSMMSMWSLLSQELGNVINLRELLKPFVDAGLDIDTDRGQSLLDVIGSFLGIYDYSALTFGNSTSQAGSGMGDLIEGYGLTTIQTQVCQYLQTSSQPLNLAFTAGTTTTPSTLAEITAIPSPTPEYDRNITDPTVMACCPNPGNCIFSEGSKFYPPESSIAGSNCFCGSMLGGGGIAFRTGSCLEENQCSQEKPCGEGKVCLTGNCCGDGTNPVNVCVDATECNAPRVGKRWADLFEGTAMGMV